MRTIKFPLKKTPQPSTTQSSVQQSPRVETLKKVDTLLNKSVDVLYRVKSVFPFDFFPDEIIISREKIDILIGMFYKSKEVASIGYEQILDVTLDFDLFFATIDFKLHVGQEVPSAIRFLKKDEAIKLRRLVTGLVIAKKENIDLTQLSNEEVVDKMIEIGKARE